MILDSRKSRDTFSHRGAADGYFFPSRCRRWVLLPIAVPRWVNRRATYHGLRNRAAQCVTKIPRPGRACTRRRTCAHARMRACAGARRSTPAHARRCTPRRRRPGPHLATPRAPVPLAPTHRSDSDPPFIHDSCKFAHPSHLFCTAPANLPTHHTFSARLLQICLPIAPFMHGHWPCTYLLPLLHMHPRPWPRTRPRSVRYDFRIPLHRDCFCHRGAVGGSASPGDRPRAPE